MKKYIKQQIRNYIVGDFVDGLEEVRLEEIQELIEGVQKDTLNEFLLWIRKQDDALNLLVDSENCISVFLAELNR